MTYNGWKNYDTWNMFLWINEDEDLYRTMCKQIPFTAETCETFCRDIFPNGTPDMEGEEVDWADIDWQSIADGFNE